MAFTSKTKHFCGWYKEYRDENPNPDYLETSTLVKGKKKLARKLIQMQRYNVKSMWERQRWHRGGKVSSLR